jgi:MbtH protein
MEREPEGRYAVVVNHEEQYSIWPAETELPAGWRREGTEGSRAECLEHVEAVWTDLRPLSLRQRMDASPGTAST